MSAAEIQRDYSTLATAEHLAALIEAYWHRSGHPEVICWAERSQAHDGGRKGDRIWGVKSNLVNGLPPRRKDEP